MKSMVITFTRRTLHVLQPSFDFLLVRGLLAFGGGCSGERTRDIGKILNWSVAHVCVHDASGVSTGKSCTLSRWPGI